MNETCVYDGRDLEAMSFARRYHRWILEIFEPYLGTRLVEVGAGVGSFSELLLERPSCESLALVEPSRAMYARLTERLAALHTPVRLLTFNAAFTEVAAAIKAEQKPDSIIYVNVMEHIADDDAELRDVHRSLAPGGRVFIFAPALPWLYGSFDRLIRHRRRYTRTELENKCRAAGFRVVKSHYFDFAGIIPWWVKYRLFKSEAMEAGAVEFYDRFIVPIVKTVERNIRPPVGKNVVLIAEKI